MEHSRKNEVKLTLQPTSGLILPFFNPLSSTLFDFAPFLFILQEKCGVNKEHISLSFFLYSLNPK
jgi:hypothetical protein